MSIAKVLSLRVRPLQASHLCFEVDGILGESNVQLGSPVSRFDFGTFYGSLSEVVVPDGSRLRYDSQAIHDDFSVHVSTLVALRAESRKAVLDKAIRARQNAYYAKYAHRGSIIALMEKFYSPSVVDSKPDRLAALSSISQQQVDALTTAYANDGRFDVVKTTKSFLSSNTSSFGSSNTAASDSGVTSSTGSTGSTTSFDNGTHNSQTFSASSSLGFAEQDQTITNFDYGYRMPLLESQAQNHRAQISLMDQQFTQFMYGQNLSDLKQVFLNELEAIDLDVKRLQVADLNTILMSPINGIVTGIYKNLGDSVKAGEPVIRVESNSAVILLATLTYRELITIGSIVTVQTTLFDSSSVLLPTSVTGSVVAVRGHRYEDDQWDVLVSCNNIDGLGNPIFPLDYHFDYDDTVVAIT
jgi:hypothetical protein